MRRVCWPVTLALLLVPGVAHAIQLHWGSAADTLTFSEATRAILVLRADSAEVTLPPEWRLLWVGDSAEVEFVALDSLEVCAGDTAQVYGVDGPATSEDSTAHQITAHFCSGGSSASERAAYVVDLPAWARGKCKVVALDPADSSRVLESNEVTFNGGVSDSFPPVVLAATQSRAGNAVLVNATGAGLGAAERVEIVAPDSSWTVRLATVQLTNTTLSATAEVPASLPPALLEVAGEGDCVATAPLLGDEVLAPEWAYSYGSYLSPHPTIWRPKDFTLFYDELGHFHLFFMRQETASGPGADSVEKVIGHVKGTDLRQWSSVQYTLATQPSSGSGWDSKYLFAPFLYQHGGTYYLFYTGVDANDNQSIGLTTTSDINSPNGIDWNSAVRATNKVEQPPWASNDPNYGKQCRDPFVMHSAFSDSFYMLFTTTRRDEPNHRWVSAIGAARSRDLLSWTPLGPLEIVDVPLSGGYPLQDKAESNHAFLHVNRHLSVNPPQAPDTSYYLLSTSNHPYPEIVALLRSRQSPWDLSPDTGADHWQYRGWLYDELGLDCETCVPDYVYNGWEATEYCGISYAIPSNGSQVLHEYLAGINYSPGDDGTAAIWIVMMRWVDGGAGSDQMTLLDPVADAGDRARTAVVERSGLRLVSRNPSSGATAFEMALGRSGHASLAVFDAQGRRIRVVADDKYSAGRHRARWDGRDDSYRLVGSGVYFARLDWEGGHGVVRCLVLH